MGCSFPVLQRVIQTDLARVGRRVGILLLANIVGSMAGTILTGWILLEDVGTSGTLKLLAGGGAVFAILAAERWWRSTPSAARRTAPAAVATATAAMLVVSPVFLIPDNETLWARLHGGTANRSVIVEDRSGLSLIRTEPRLAVVFVNGMSQSVLPYGGLHTALGAIPALVHPDPRTAVVIGLGSGDTVHAVSGRKQIERIICIEIIGGQLRALKALDGRQRFGGLQTLLNDPRVSQVYGDGRIHLVQGESTYDIIEADALQPHTSHSGNLYLGGVLRPGARSPQPARTSGDLGANGTRPQQFSACVSVRDRPARHSARKPRADRHRSGSDRSPHRRPVRARAFCGRRR